MILKTFVTLTIIAVVFAEEYDMPSYSVPQIVSPLSSPAPFAYKHMPKDHSAPVLEKQVIVEYQEEESPSQYEFAYGVHDEHTGDMKEQKETRKDGGVEGYYTLKEADGTRRIVHYTANEHDGFNAAVTYEGTPTKAPYVTPTHFKVVPLNSRHGTSAYVSFMAPYHQYSYQF